jgi:hypothetical protein
VRNQLCSVARVISVVMLAAFSADVAGQRRAPGQGPSAQRIQVSLNIGGESYRSNAPGKCSYAPMASIFQVVSELWSVQQSEEDRSLSMSYWKPKDGSSDMVTLSVNSGSTSHRVNTVRGGGATSGSGKVTFQKTGEGGTFTIDAKTKSGAAMTGTIQCDTLAPHMAEGG